MKLYAPKYYKNFTCIAHKCKHSCCIGWEIDIDNDTLNKYDNLSHPYGESIKNSIDKEETPHFRLRGNEKCPHLNQQGLCEIIINLGEDYLCHICREHPRFYNDLPNCREVGIGMACEEAARLILCSGDYSIVEIGDTVGEEFDSQIDIVSRRNNIYKTLNTEMPYDSKIKDICEKYGVTPNSFDDDFWRDVINNLEYLNKENKKRFSAYSSVVNLPQEYEIYLERALAYFIYRHCSNALDEYEFSAALGFCLFCERLFASMLVAENAKAAEQIIEIARVISEEIEYSEDNTYAIMQEF